MHSSSLIAASLSLLATTTLALPHGGPINIRRIPAGLNVRQISGDCDLSTGLDDLTVPFASTTPPLGAPSDDFFLSSIVVGRGVQNVSPSPSTPLLSRH
jgi:hypothetical protein